MYIEETYESIRKNKVRSLLTGFGVWWGIFILVILLGAGEGFYQGVLRKFSGYAMNNIWFFSGQRPDGTPVVFTASLLENLQKNVSGIEHISPVVTPQVKGLLLHYQDEEYSQGSLKGVGINYEKVAQTVLENGRFFNHRDEDLNRVVCVIGSDVRDILFKKEDPIGKYMSVNGFYAQIIGLLDKEATFNRDDQRTVLFPLRAAQRYFGTGLEFGHFRLSLQPGCMAQTAEKEIRAYLAEQLRFDPSDPKALYGVSFSKSAQDFNNFFGFIRAVVWVVGICMLLSGIVGISNMMLVTVKERTQEIGIRKVLGANSGEILLMVLSESVFICLISGILGMLMGVGVIHMINTVIDHVDPQKSSTMAHLAFKFSEAVAALLVLVVVGAIAGIAPAKRATAILPIKALKSE